MQVSRSGGKRGIPGVNFSGHLWSGRPGRGEQPMNLSEQDSQTDSGWDELGSDESRPGYSLLRRLLAPVTAAIVALAVLIWATGGADGGESLGRDMMLLGLLAVAGGCVTLVRRWWDPLPLGYLRAASGSQRRVAELLTLSGGAAVGVGIVVMVVAGLL